jgi:hypothetical protein
MISIARKAALGAAAILALGAFATPAPADQPGSGSPHAFALRGEITGSIAFPVSLLPHGYNSKACRDFSVTASGGKSGKLHAKLAGGTVECGYTIAHLPPGSYTVIPHGYPRGYAGRRCGGFDSPAGKHVTLRVRFGTVTTGHANFTYSAGSANECAAPNP